MSGSRSLLQSSIPRASSWRLGLGYGVMVAVTVGLFLAIRSYGEHLAPAAADAVRTAGPPAARSDILFHVLVALVAIILAGRWMGKLCLHFGQPRVIGE